MKPSSSITSSILLIVEGEDDKRFIKSLFNHLSITNIQIFPIGGKTKLRENLKALSLAPNFNNVKTIGIIRDADNNPSGAFQSVCDALKSININAPQNQLIINNSIPKTAVMILPRPDEEGMLEDICLDSLTDKPEIECISNYLDCIYKKTNKQCFNLSKSKLYAFISVTSDPELRLGEAAEKGVFNFNHSSFTQLINFLKLISNT